MFRAEEAHQFNRPPLCQLPGSLFRYISWFLTAPEKCTLGLCSRYCDEAICGSKWTPVSGEWLRVISPQQRRWIIKHGITPTRADFKTPSEVYAWVDWTQLERISILRETKNDLGCCTKNNKRGWTKLFDQKLLQLCELTLKFWCVHTMRTVPHWSKLVELYLDFSFKYKVSEELYQCLIKADCPNLKSCSLPAGCPLPLIASGRLQRLHLHASNLPGPIFQLGRNKRLEIDIFVFTDHPNAQFPEPLHIKKWIVNQDAIDVKQFESVLTRHSHFVDAVEHNEMILSLQKSSFVLSGKIRLDRLHELADKVQIDMGLKVRILSLTSLCVNRSYPMISFVNVVCDFRAEQLICGCMGNEIIPTPFDPKYAQFFVEKIRVMFPHAEITCQWCKRSLP